MEKRTYQSLQELPLMLSMMDVASVLGISKAGAYTLAHSRDFPAFRVGRRIVISQEKFLDWLEKQAAGDKQNAPFNNYPYNPLSIFQFVIMPSAAPAGPYRGNSPPLPRGS